MIDVGPVAPAVLCDRCGCPAAATWCDVSTFGKRSFVMSGAVCSTPGCVDDDGSAEVPPPDVPGQLTREDRRWIRRQEQLANELVLADRRLVEATKDMPRSGL